MEFSKPLPKSSGDAYFKREKLVFGKGTTMGIITIFM
jgi:hypothetical protein